VEGKVNGRVRDCSLGTLLRSLRVGGEERQRFSIRPRFNFASGECISGRVNAGRTLMNILPILTTARPSPNVQDSDLREILRCALPGAAVLQISRQQAQHMHVLVVLHGKGARLETGRRIPCSAA